MMKIESLSEFIKDSPPVESAQYLPLCDANPEVEQYEESERLRPVTVAWIVVWLFMSEFCFLQSKGLSWSTPTTAKEAAAAHTTPKRFESKAIRDIRTGMRVIADNPELNGEDAHQAEINPETCRNISLRMEKPDGGELLMTLLRSLDWLESHHHAETGHEIHLSFPELGIDGLAKVLALDPCPPIETGNGRVVTGTFRHSAANVIDLFVSGEDQPIGTTANHPFWSEDRQEFVQAGDLELGEELLTSTGIIAKVQKITPRNGLVSVFNLEVDVEHCFAVGDSGVVVHNSQSYGGNAANIPEQTVVDYTAELTRNSSNATRTLRKNLSTNADTHRAHHIIPLQTSDHPVVQAAARGGFNINGANNGVNLESTVHPQGARHPRYNAAVQRQLDNLAVRNLTDTQAAAEVQAIADRLHPGLERLNQTAQPLR